MTPATTAQSRNMPSAAPLARLTAALDRLACVVCIALFVGILGIMVLQVSFRYVLNTPLVWTEELARILYIWACYLGAPVALRRGNHVTILVVLERLPRGLGRLVGLGIHAISLMFFVALAILGTGLMIRSHTVDAITLPIPWSVIYLAVPLSAALMILQTLAGGWQLFQGGGEEARA
jgi:TRAP-type C4-dicarboxylate transport system permease small subunit